MTSAANGNGHIHAIRLTIPAKPEYITLGRLALTGHRPPAPSRFAEEVLGDLKLALTEACTNSVRHAYAGGDGDGRDPLRAARDRLVVEVTDDGRGLRAAAERGDARRDDELTEGGLGIAIIQALADEFEIGERPRRRLAPAFVEAPRLS